MKKGLILGLSLIVIMLTACRSQPTPTQSRPTMPAPTSQITSQRHFYPQWNADLHIIRIKPGNEYTIEPKISSSVDMQSADNSQVNSQVIIAINAGFFDPVNQKSTSHITIASQVAADSEQNERLIQNPNLKPYLSQIVNRSEFRRYECEREFRYAITRYRTKIPKDCQLVDAIGGGPQLLPELTVIEEAFFDPKTGRDPIGYNQPNSRSAIGITADGDILIALVAQTDVSGGLTLPQLAQRLKTAGAVTALNLDGGTSSALFYNGTTIVGKRDDNNQPIVRPVKSVIVVKKRS